MGVVNRISKVGTTLWEHKKKTAFAGFLCYLGIDFGIKMNTNRKIRAAYSLLAIEIGKQPISAEDRPRRVTVLANVAANERHCYDNFTKNALPLMHLAGLQVDVIKADSEKQLEQLAAALDSQEADAIYIVGGDGTLGRVVTGIFRNKESPALPIGVFPGGYDCLTLKRLVPGVFESSEDCRRFCESAMALIEEQKRLVPVFKIDLIRPKVDIPAVAEVTTTSAGEGEEAAIAPKEPELPELPSYSVGDVGAGWFRYIEDRRRKLWYFGALKRRWAYIWEMIKRGPKPLELDIVYEEACAGCQKCRPPPVIIQPEWRWWHVLTGTPRIVQKEVQKDYTGIVNEKCGNVYETKAQGTDMIVENVPEEDSSFLRMRVGGNVGRFGVISEGMRRCSEDRVGVSSADSFYSTDLIGSMFKIRFDSIPEFISRIYISSDASPIAKGTTAVLQNTQKKVELYLPNQLRIDPTTL